MRLRPGVPVFHLGDGVARVGISRPLVVRDLGPDEARFLASLEGRSVAVSRRGASRLPARDRRARGASRSPRHHGPDLRAAPSRPRPVARMRPRLARGGPRARPRGCRHHVGDRRQDRPTRGSLPGVGTGTSAGRGLRPRRRRDRLRRALGFARGRRRCRGPRVPRIGGARATPVPPRDGRRPTFSSCRTRTGSRSAPSSRRASPRAPRASSSPGRTSTRSGRPSRSSSRPPAAAPASTCQRTAPPSREPSPRGRSSRRFGATLVRRADGGSPPGARRRGGPSPLTPAAAAGRGRTSGTQEAADAATMAA